MYIIVGCIVAMASICREYCLNAVSRACDPRLGDRNMYLLLQDSQSLPV